ncbi:metalloregulator ArsR/SmtB family transcription factor [Nonomuraea sp. NPDC049784]|uniref:ArsR/SmtB family transcription factor n=1 Tax=Nonomuraea sp. NPDC049784 TaxID=3154361 RepID=UPI0033C100CE
MPGSSSRELFHPEAADLVLTDVLFALSDPARLEITRRLAGGPLEVAACQPTGGDMPKSTLSHHIKILREAGVVRNDPHGRQRYVTLRRQDLEKRFPGILDLILREASDGDRL